MDIRFFGIAGTLGTVAIGGGTYWAMTGSKQSISTLLTSEKGLLLIEDFSDEKWNDAWKKYKESTDKENKWGIKNWDRNHSLETAPREFKEECQRRAKVKVSEKESKEYQDVKTWCTRPKKVSELLSSEGKKVLLSQTGDAKEWGEMWTAYKKHHENSPQTEGSPTYKTPNELEVSDWPNKASQSEIPAEYKTACQTKAGSYIDVTKITEDPVFKKVETWCTKDKSE